MVKSNMVRGFGCLPEQNRIHLVRFDAPLLQLLGQRDPCGYWLQNIKDVLDVVGSVLVAILHRSGQNLMSLQYVESLVFTYSAEIYIPQNSPSTWLVVNVEDP